MKIALINPAKCKSGYLAYSNGLSSLKGTIEKTIGAEMRIVYSKIEQNNKSESNGNGNIENEASLLVKEINDYSPDLIGLSLMSANYNFAKKIIKKIKEEKNLNSIKIIVGGHLPTSSYDALLQDNQDIDCCFLGEAENNLKIFLEKNLDVENTPGVAFIKNGKVIKNNNENDVDINAISYSMDFILSEVKRVHKKNKDIAIPLEIQRGCSYSKCTFCDIHNFYRSSNKHPRLVRYRSIDNILEDISFWNKEGYNLFALEDDALGNPNYLLELNKRLNVAKKRNRFVITARAEEIKRFSDTLENIFANKYMSINGISIGFEAATDKALSLINKGTRASQNEEAINVIRNLSKKYGRNTSIIFNMILLTHPDISMDELINNFQFIGKHITPADRLLPSIATVAYPGTKFWHELTKRGYIPIEDDGYAIQNYSFADKEVDKVNKYLTKRLVRHYNNDRESFIRETIELSKDSLNHGFYKRLASLAEP